MKTDVKKSAAVGKAGGKTAVVNPTPAATKASPTKEDKDKRGRPTAVAASLKKPTASPSSASTKGTKAVSVAKDVIEEVGEVPIVFLDLLLTCTACASAYQSGGSCCLQFCFGSQWPVVCNWQSHSCPAESVVESVR